VGGSSETNGGKAREGILLVDDDQVLVDLLAYLARQAGFEPLVASDPAGAITQFETHHPVVAVVDLNLKPYDGFELLQELRGRSPTLPILVLTARADEDDKVRAFDLGADDYVVKPFGHREFLARLKAHARRARGERAVAPRPVVEFGPLRLDTSDHTLHVKDETYRLTPTEFRLLQFLMRHGSSTVPMAAVAKQVWGYDDPPAREAARVTVHRLRRKLGGDGTHQRFIHTVPGVGLRLDPGLLEGDRTS
jgi:DNA-binding response OmpR family regulator